MQNRTYRYFNGDVLYPFGYGLSYTTFSYGKLRCPEQSAIGDSLTFTLDVRNTGHRAGEEVVQVYLSHRAIDPTAPRCQLVRFRKVALEPGERQTLTFRLSTRDLAYVDAAGNVATEPGDITLFAGGVCPSAPERFTDDHILSQTVTLVGEPVDFDY